MDARSGRPPLRYGSPRYSGAHVGARPPGNNPGNPNDRSPIRPEDAIMKGIAGRAEHGPAEIIHGSTVATNALIERKGARTALLTTEGFEDILVIGRQTRPELYNIFVTRPAPLVSDGLRIGISERTLYDGSIETPLDKEQVQEQVEFLRSHNVESVAVS